MSSTQTAKSLRLLFKSKNHVPQFMQTEVAECGLACLGMVASYFGYDSDLISLRRKFPISSKGLNLKNLMDLANQLYLNARAIRTDIDNLNHIKLPCILHWDMNHFVVLKAIKNGSYLINDPAQGEKALTQAEIKEYFTGVALELTPTVNFVKKEEKNELKLGDFFSHIIGFKRNLAILLCLSLLLELFSLASPYYMQTVVDDVLLRDDRNLLIALSIGFFLLVIIQIGTSRLRELVVLNISSRLSLQMSTNLFTHLIRLPLNYFSKRHIGDIVSRFGALATVREMLTHSLVSVIIDGLLASLTLVAMFFYNAELTFVVIAVVILYALLRWAFFYPFKKLNEEILVASAKESSHFMESLRAIQTIKIFEKENERINQWQNRLVDVMNKSVRISKWSIIYSSINGLLFGLENIFIVYLAANNVIDNIMTIGMLYAFMSYQGRFIGAMDGLINQWIQLKMLNVQLNRLADITFTPQENANQNITTNLLQDSLATENKAIYAQLDPICDSKITGKIEVRDLGFRYSPYEPYVFKNINFVIESGETVAIIGESGCGKSTLLKCLLGLIEPTEGQILIDDKPIHSLRTFRSQIAAVMQDDQLLAGDIVENISCFSSQVDINKVLHCSTMACLHEEIMRMPMQYQTLIGDMGSNLSGGQKQRLILARALYREPKILFMDEATSHLDVKNESIVNENIRNLAITRVIVAHRPETVASARRQIMVGSHSGN